MARFPTGAVVIGASAAGIAAAEGLREGGYQGSIIVLDEELDPGFDRPILSKGLLRSGDQTPPHQLRSAEQLAAKQITVLGYHRAMGLDVDRRLVVTSWGEAIPFHHVVIATGVDAQRLLTDKGNPVPALRNRDDLATLRALVAAGEPVTGIGAGFIGLEAASELRQRGIAVRLISALDLPLEPYVGRETAEWMVGLHHARGVTFETGTRIAAVEESDPGFVLHAADGRSLDAPALFSGAGSCPNTDWLLGSGVELARGVLTDQAGRTNVAGVWAAGDVATLVDPATGSHQRFEHWTHAIEQGRHVGLNIALGETAPYRGVPYFWTEAYGHTLHVLGTPHPEAELSVIDGSLGSDTFVAEHRVGDDVCAVSISGAPTAIYRYKKLLKAKALA